MTSPYDLGLAKNDANYQPLTPLSFLERSAKVYPAHTAIIHGEQRFTYAEFYARSRKLASALASRGIGKGDTVSVMLANTPPMLECHYGVPMTGAVLTPSTRGSTLPSSPSTLDHAEHEGADRRPRILRGDEGSFVDDQGQAHRHRLRRPRVSPGRPADPRPSTRPSSLAATPTLPGRCPMTSGTPSRSTTPPARPATPRASSTTTAAQLPDVLLQRAHRQPA
jgi:acyl-CoA synthetase (AMP-forming)/AMP-acid ligase II